MPCIFYDKAYVFSDILKYSSSLPFFEILLPVCAVFFATNQCRFAHFDFPCILLLGAFAKKS